MKITALGPLRGRGCRRTAGRASRQMNYSGGLVHFFGRTSRQRPWNEGEKDAQIHCRESEEVVVCHFLRKVCNSDQLLEPRSGYSALMFQ